MRSWIVNVLLAVLSLSLSALAAAGVWAWLHPQRRQAQVADLTPADRQRLVEDILDVTGNGVYRSMAWLDPKLSYTLRPNIELTTWNATFTSNELGYRAGSVKKDPGTYRIVVAGDSWTYGQGVARVDAFPAQLEALANSMLEAGPRVEVWPLALPGYNALNQTAALELFFERLQPDVVVLCPTRNDTDSNFIVLPTGLPKRPSGEMVDVFGDDHWRSYPVRFVASYRSISRWRQAFSEYRRLETWLREQQVPLFMFFVAYWEPEFVHRLAAEARLEAPYAIVPKAMMTSRWIGPRPWGHGTPETYEVYSRMLYRLLEAPLSWPRLDRDAELDPFDSILGPAVEERRTASDPEEVLAEYSRQIPTRYVPAESSKSCAGNMDCASGRMGRGTTLILRRLPGVSRLRIAVERLAEKPSLYPLELAVEVPSAGGGTRTRTTIPKIGPIRHELLVDLPPDIRDGTPIDVELRADRASLDSFSRGLEALSVVLLEQL